MPSSGESTFALGVPSRERLPAVLLVVLAVALVAWSGWYVYDDFRPEYDLSATEIDSAPADADVRSVDDLSPDAKTAFGKARGGDYVVHREPAWLGTFPLYDSVYVRGDGTVYRVWARSDDVDGLSVILAAPAVLLAVGLGALGVRSYRRRTVRTPLAVLAAFGAVAFGRLFDTALSVAGLPVGSAWVTVFAALAAGVGAWLYLGRSDLV